MPPCGLDDFCPGLQGPANLLLLRCHRSVAADDGDSIAELNLLHQQGLDVMLLKIFIQRDCAASPAMRVASHRNDGVQPGNDWVPVLPDSSASGSSPSGGPKDFDESRQWAVARRCRWPQSGCSRICCLVRLIAFSIKSVFRERRVGAVLEGDDAVSVAATMPAPLAMRAASMFTSPMSLTMTATAPALSPFGSGIHQVVVPAPRYQ